MKKILFTLVLAFSLTNFVLAQKSNNTACQSGDNALARARIISREEMTVTGSFQFTIQVEAFENCTLDSIRIINDGTFLNVSFNGSLSKSQNISQPNFTLKNLSQGQISTCTITINHATTLASASQNL